MDLRHTTVSLSMDYAISREHLFRKLTDEVAAWLSPTSSLPTTVGAPIRLALRPGPEMPHGREIGLGNVLAVEPGTMIEFTYHKDGSFDMVPGQSKVRIVLEDRPGGSRMNVSQTVHEHPTHSDAILPDGTPRPDDYSYEMLVHRIEFFWELVFGWLAGSLRDKDVETMARLARTWVESYTHTPKPELKAHFEALMAPHSLVLDANSGVVHGRDALAIHFDRLRDHLPPGFTIVALDEPPHVGFTHGLVRAEGRGRDGSVLTVVDFHLTYGPGPRIERVEVVWNDRD